MDNVKPLFSSFAFTDLWQPNDKVTVNLGARFDHFAYATNDLASGYPARQFWFNAYNRENCGALGAVPVSTFNSTTGTFGPCPAGLAPLSNPGNGLYDTGGGLSVHNVFQPRVSFTWTLNPDTVIRGSYGKYARAEASSYYQYNTVQQDLPSFLAQFYSYGYHTPNHDINPDTSDNYDLSLEKHFKGTSTSFKLTPFYRSTRNQIQYLSIDPLGGTLAGLNVGTLKSSGVEVSLQGGDFAKPGFAYNLSYTHTSSSIRFAPINGQTVVDSLNSQVKLYNSYTYQCSLNEAAPECGGGLYAANGAATLPNANGTNITNPYFCPATSASCPYTKQGLFDPNGSYAPYDVIPTPFNAANGYEVPDVVSLVANYRYKRFAVTPSLRWNNGADYGSPLTYPGYVPQGCTGDPAATPTTPGITCGGGGAIFIPDPFNGNRFDTLGVFKQPSQFTMNLQMSYDLSNRASVTMSAVNVINKCFQRGYAWDNPTTCVYSTLPSNILAPSGNFLTAPPVQTKYPYGTFFNITEVGTTSVIQPFNFFVNLNIKL